MTPVDYELHRQHRYERLSEAATYRRLRQVTGLRICKARTICVFRPPDRRAHGSPLCSDLFHAELGSSVGARLRHSRDRPQY
jgi:hypothetical protein